MTNPLRDYDALAASMIAEVVDDPGARARRIAGLYSSLFLEDPLLQSWAGLAGFVCLQVSRLLENAVSERLATGNLHVYSSMMPALLRFRDGSAVQGPLGLGMARLAEADRLARTDLDAAFHVVARSVEDLSVVEQRDVVQQVYDGLSDAHAKVLSRVYLFRLGWDTAAEVVRFRGTDVRDAEQRVAWMRQDILPTWERARRERMEWLRADADRIRRHAGVRVEHLPARLDRPSEWRGVVAEPR